MKNLKIAVIVVIVYKKPNTAKIPCGVTCSCGAMLFLILKIRQLNNRFSCRFLYFVFVKYIILRKKKIAVQLNNTLFHETSPRLL
ncbi:hypothetical protein BpHYR1_022349 [Brachionus plicatilis]|uniref:Uncharacterized protein n=1 Tax=Brachionus plicatilis TaxID=10195 RepID=A0A3M7T2Z8_BRAPC|nr:hypothetical protein BpHYR1_022349 [Brachionus plicatilis]